MKMKKKDKITKRAVVMVQSLSEVGEIGEVVSVSCGYARNYLIPRGYALADSKYAHNLIQSRHKMIADNRAQRRAQAEEQKTLIEQESCQIKMRASENGKLFGAVTAHALTEELAKRSVHIDAKTIRIPHNKINALGEHSIPVHLYEDVHATLTLQVEAQQE